jgi:hypothetical protein
MDFSDEAKGSFGTRDSGRSDSARQLAHLRVFSGFIFILGFANILETHMGCRGPALRGSDMQGWTL